ncbi:hypothetical protein SETIT_9G383100v2 [Setaria italica]|uniref:Uncharacterized protein n=2 Tax=Setaria TaxID=4554 RepID=A0A368SS31_SETIT|nr:hypothetical protein SETIT_9G383100v2 [Setaria italica]TKV95832.1 hypothetical protein SEVIR_9G387600v2 [Setaria viridis]
MQRRRPHRVRRPLPPSAPLSSTPPSLPPAVPRPSASSSSSTSVATHRSSTISKNHGKPAPHPPSREGIFGFVLAALWLENDVLGQEMDKGKVSHADVVYSE